MAQHLSRVLGAGRVLLVLRGVGGIKTAAQNAKRLKTGSVKEVQAELDAIKERKAQPVPAFALVFAAAVLESKDAIAIAEAVVKFCDDSSCPLRFQLVASNDDTVARLANGVMVALKEVTAELVGVAVATEGEQKDAQAQVITVNLPFALFGSQSGDGGDDGQDGAAQVQGAGEAFVQVVAVLFFFVKWLQCFCY